MEAEELLSLLWALDSLIGPMAEMSRLSSINTGSFFSLYFFSSSFFSPSLRRISSNFKRGTCTLNLPELLLDEIGIVWSLGANEGGYCSRDSLTIL